MVPNDKSKPAYVSPDYTKQDVIHVKDLTMNGIQTNGMGKRLVVNLDIVEVSTKYMMEICASYNFPSATKLSGWMVYTYIQMRDYPNVLLSSIDWMNLTTVDACWNTVMNTSSAISSLG